MPDYRDEFYSKYHVANQMPTTPDLARYHAYARQYAGRWNKWLPTDKSSNCLDLACGGGEFLVFLKQSGYNNIFGVDLNQAEISLGEQMGLTGLTNGSVLEYLADKESAYELISAFNLFEHLKKEEILQLLTQIYRALKPGGRLIAVTPNGISPFSGTTRYWDFSHETSFTPASWRQLANVMGFVSPVFEEYGPLTHSATGIIRTALWQCIRLGILGISYIEVASPRDSSRVYTADMKIILTKSALP